MLFIRHINISTSERMLSKAVKRGYKCGFTAAAAVQMFKRFYPGKTLLFYFEDETIRLISEEYKNSCPELATVPITTTI